MTIEPVLTDSIFQKSGVVGKRASKLTKFAGLTLRNRMSTGAQKLVENSAFFNIRVL